MPAPVTTHKTVPKDPVTGSFVPVLLMTFKPMIASD